MREWIPNRTRSAFRAALFAGAAVIVLTSATSARAAAPVPPARTVRAFMTLYGYADNSPPGRAIAHRCIRHVAGGVGTFGNPVTVATDVKELGWCKKIYVPYMKRYFIHEDECVECDHDWAKLHAFHFDMWAGGDASSRANPEKAALVRCEDTWTRADTVNDPRNPKITINPPPNLPVSTAPVFSPPKRCWNGH